MRVDVTDLSVRLGGHTILERVSLSVPSGTVLGLLGPNGSGKSTLLRTVSGITPPPPGRVRYDGTDLSTLPRRATARRVAVMSQEHGGEFEIPVIDLVLLGRIPHGRGFGPDSADDLAIASAALSQVGALHLAERFATALSGGERQRVLLARALAQDTPVLVLDEPTNHLDIAHQLDLLDLVRDSGRTVLTALHDLNLAARSCDALAVLEAGRLVRHGTPAEVLDGELIRSVFDVDSTPVVHPHAKTRHFLFDARSHHSGVPPTLRSPTRSMEGITHR